MDWQLETAPEQSARGSAAYDAVEAQDGLFFVQYLREDKDIAVSLALDLASGCGIVVQNVILAEGRRPTSKRQQYRWRELDLRQEISAGAIVGSSAAGPIPSLSADLVGKRFYAEYSPGVIAEHVYLNARRFVWQGLGEDKYESDAGCEHSTTWKIRTGVYLLTWVEENQPATVVLLMDFTSSRNTGVIFGVDEEGLAHALVGAKLGPLGEITYPKGYEPAHWRGS